MRGRLQDRPPLLLGVSHQPLQLRRPARLQQLAQTLGPPPQDDYLGLALSSGAQHSLEVGTDTVVSQRFIWGSLKLL